MTNNFLNEHMKMRMKEKKGCVGNFSLVDLDKRGNYIFCVGEFRMWVRSASGLGVFRISRIVSLPFVQEKGG